MCRRRRCDSIQSAPARSNSSNSSRTNALKWRKTWIIGSRDCPTSMASNIRSSRAAQPRSAFVAGKYELTFAGTLTIPLPRDLQKQRPDAICELPPGSVSTNLIVNRDKPPFDNPELRQALSLALDRQAFIDIVTEGQGFRAAAMQPPPGGRWGMPREMLDE